MPIKTSLLALSFALFAGVAASQPASWPIVHGRHLQPTEREFDSLGDDGARAWRRGVQPQVDRLYDEIIRRSEIGVPRR